MNERVKFLGQLVEAEQEERKLKLVADGLVISLRDLLDPIGDVGGLRVDLIMDQAISLANTTGSLREKRQTINRIKDELGR